MHDKVLIIGAGPAGLCLALALAARDLEVEILERQPAEALVAPPFDGREIALTHGTMRLLRELGVWQHIPGDEVASLRRARVMDDHAHGFDLDGAPFGREKLGVFVSNNLIRAAAWRAVQDEPRIRVRTEVTVSRVATDAARAQVFLQDGEVLEAALLVAADSRFSQTRRSMGIPVHMHDFGKTMVLCRMRHAQANDGTAWEWFGHGQTRALLPLGEHLSSTIITLPDVEAQALMQLDPEAFSRDITARYENRLGAMELASTRHAYPLVATWARRFVGTRFALAGDAAVGMHPVTAHGFNLGMTSVEYLARAVGDGLQSWRDAGHPQALERYQRLHRAGGAVIFAGTQMVAGLFTDERALAQPLRSLALGVVRRVPALQRALVSGLVDENTRPQPFARHLGRAFQILRPRLGGSRV